MAEKFHVSEADANEASGWRIFTWDIESLGIALKDASDAAARSDLKKARVSSSQSVEEGPWKDLYEVKCL